MDTNYYGLIIGIDHYIDPELELLQYAEKDASDLYNVLTDPAIGKFSRANLDLMLGEDARLNDVQIKLFDRVVKREITDTVLVYFAGHALPVGERIYLVPSDVSKSQIENNRLKHISLSLDSLRENIFCESRAKNIVIILDACYSGSILQKERGGIRRDLQARILETFQDFQPSSEPGQIRSIIVSSGPSSPSMEYSEYKNGVFTHHLLEGLRRGAVDGETGDVTIEGLLDYVKSHVRKGQQPGGYINGFGRVVLVHHQNPGVNRDAIKYFSTSEIKKISTYPELVPLASSLESYQSLIQEFIGQLTQYPSMPESTEERVIEALRLSTKTEMVLVVDKQNGGWELRIKKQQENLKSDEIVEAAVPTLLAGIQAQSDCLTRDRVGSFSHIKISERSIEAIAIPVSTNCFQKVVVLCGNAGNLDILKNDLFAQVVSGIYYALEKSHSCDATQIEANLLDYLRTFHKYLPAPFYERRSVIFNQRLHKMSVRFQPIIYIGMDYPFVCGFESLASDPETNTTPLDLMKAAELWGTRFKIDLDSYFFETTIITYKRRLKETPGYRRPQDVPDLSINVYPETLLRSAYYSKVAELLDKKLIPPYKLYLEISEKSPSPEVVPGEGVATKGMLTFRDILMKYVRDFRIGFAIDDFGIGHSSVARLAELTPSYVKIDREILKLSTAYETIKYTLDFIDEIVSSKHLSSSKVVLEGYDEEISQSLSLKHLMHLGIQFIQTYLVGMPTDQLARLKDEQRNYLFSLMNR